jgi:hypothetical protein
MQAESEQAAHELSFQLGAHHPQVLAAVDERTLDADWQALRQSLSDPAATRRDGLLARAPAPAQTPDAPRSAARATETRPDAGVEQVRRFLDERDLPPHADTPGAFPLPAPTPHGELDVWVIADGDRPEEIVQSHEVQRTLRLNVGRRALERQVEELLRAILGREPVIALLRTLYDEVGRSDQRRGEGVGRPARGAASGRRSALPPLRRPA